MVVEDETGLVGYAVAALDARQFYSKVQVAWLPEMCLKYPVPQQTAEKPSVEEVKYCLTDSEWKDYLILERRQCKANIIGDHDIHISQYL